MLIHWKLLFVNATLSAHQKTRNPQPSDRELKMADYIFYSTFDVGTLSISDKIEDRTAAIDVRCISTENVVHMKPVLSKIWLGSTIWIIQGCPTCLPWKRGAVTIQSSCSLISFPR